jgi:Glycosyl hydrolase family 3 C-terminal domain
MLQEVLKEAWGFDGQPTTRSCGYCGSPPASAPSRGSNQRSRRRTRGRTTPLRPSCGQARQPGFVLVRNATVDRAPLLPLDRTGLGRIAVLGPYAALARTLGGGSATVFRPTPSHRSRASTPHSEPRSRSTTARGCVPPTGSLWPRWRCCAIPMAVQNWRCASWPPMAQSKAENTAPAPPSPGSAASAPTFPSPRWQRSKSTLASACRIAAPICLMPPRYQPESAGGFGGETSPWSPSSSISRSRSPRNRSWSGPSRQPASQTDVAVVVVGTSEEVESEGFDRQTLTLPGRQDELVRRIVSANPRTVVVVNTGAPVLMPWAEEVPSILVAWFPAQEFGNALADVLLGDQKPGGRLPSAWPADEHPAIPSTRCAVPTTCGTRSRPG